MDRLLVIGKMVIGIGFLHLVGWGFAGRLSLKTWSSHKMVVRWQCNSRTYFEGFGSIDVAVGEDGIQIYIYSLICNNAAIVRG